jgi:hypothetical protein
MKTLIALLFISSPAFAQSVPTTHNNANVNIVGNNQNVIINQSGAGHSVNLNLYGNDIPVSVTQSGLTPQSFNLNITCYSNCSSAPTVVNQY